MHILVLSMWYAPEPVGKPHNLAKGLVQLGHDVTVVTTFPNYPQGQLYAGYHLHLRQWDARDGVRILRLPTFFDRSRSAWRRVLSYLSFALNAGVLGAMLTERPDLIWSYQIGLPGLLMSKLTRAPLVHEVQDLWPEWGRSGGMGMGGVLYKVLDWQERAIYRHAKRVCTITNGFKQALVEKGVPAEKIVTLPNWANEENFSPTTPDTELATREGLTGKFNVMYGGNIGTAQGMAVVLAAAALLSDLPDIQFVLIGDGVEREQLEAEAQAQGLPVRFLGSRPPERMADYLNWADALLLHLKDRPEYWLTMPSKTYGYLAMGKPLIAAATGEVADLVQKSGCGVTCAPESGAALAKAIRALYTMNATSRAEMGQRGRQLFQREYTSHTIVPKYEALFQSLIMP